MYRLMHYWKRERDKDYTEKDSREKLSFSIGGIIYTINKYHPTGNLDSAATKDVMGLLLRAVREFGQTVVMITHNELLTAECDRILVMEDGKLTERGGAA